MVATMITSLPRFCFSASTKTFVKRTPPFLYNRPNTLLLKFPNTCTTLPSLTPSKLLPFCFFNAGKDNPDFQQKEETELGWPIRKRWEGPWEWQTVSLTSLACGLSFILTGLIETAAIPYLGLNIEELSLDQKAEILFVDQSITTIVVLGVLYGVANTFQPLPEDLFRYDFKEPFNLKKGWLLWAAIGLVGALIAIALTGAAMSLFRGEDSQRETDALVRLLPLIGSSSISTACLVGITGVLAPVLEETNGQTLTLLHLGILGFNNISIVWPQFVALAWETQGGHLKSQLSKYKCGHLKYVLKSVCGINPNGLKQASFSMRVVNCKIVKCLVLLNSLCSPATLVPTPVSVIISAAVFALAHLTPGEFPQLFQSTSGGFAVCNYHFLSFHFPITFKYHNRLRYIQRSNYIVHIMCFLTSNGSRQISWSIVGTALGFSYAQTRNLVTPITIHAFWNSGVILLLTFLQLQGYDIKELLQAT
ncbi:D-alanine--D-alanine ligase [Gossypium australe]|uniref:D-alanine--D-alanine ligase n=1 Tax=Gossypium australe TaxID=47621 RepID=A0A5B6V321_9ROSI|nr:D-alanine--D-alanine ligase [Gossypium australe]